MVLASVNGRKNLTYFIQILRQRLMLVSGKAPPGLLCEKIDYKRERKPSQYRVLDVLLYRVSTRKRVCRCR